MARKRKVEHEHAKLNIGCSTPKGQYRQDDWYNIDIAPEFTKQDNVYKGDIRDIPFNDDVFEQIYAVHILEHVARQDHVQAAKEVLRVLKPGGVAWIEVPDFEATVYQLSRSFRRGDRKRIHKWTTSVYGKNRFVGDQHRWGLDEQYLLELLRDTGFRKIQRITGEKRMISLHYTQEPVLLMKATK